MRKNVKQYVVFCMILFVSIPVCAQYGARKANYYYKNRWKENIFVSAGFGGMAAMSSYNLKAGVGQMLNPYLMYLPEVISIRFGHGVQAWMDGAFRKQGFLPKSR